ncbi:MAG: chorismate-binding protein [Actinomycetota bacterium]|nr:chorismate-binding protein [Actinomycetota bacterium]
MSDRTVGSSSAPLPHAPDPGAFVATTTLLPPTSFSTWMRSIAAQAADTGVLVGGRERVLAGLGVAAALPLPHGLEDEDALLAVRAWLAAVEPAGRADDATRPSHVAALGAFAFDRSAPTTLVVPSVTWCRDADGQTWRVDVRRCDEPAVHDAPSMHDAPPGRDEPVRDDAAAPFDASSLVQVPPPAAYARAVARAVADIRAGRLSKVVLGRMLDVQLPSPPVASLILQALWAPGGLFSPFSIPTPSGRLVGASPELLVRRCGSTVTSHPLAGTVPLTGSEDDAQVQRLLDSPKDRAEHRLVVDAVAAALEQRCRVLSVPETPTVVRLGSDARLGTLVRGTLCDVGARATTALALLALLHPTPAVAGVPRGAALERIAELEPAPRGYWAGAAGWTDAAGDGEWVLAIRSVELDARRALVRAGAGVVDGSDPPHELAETTVKLRPVLDALWPGASALL